MAFFADPNLDEDENQAGPAGAQPKGLGGEGGIIGGGAAGAAAGAPGGAAKAQQGGQPAPTSSGAWTNLNSYLDANKGADARMGQGVRQAADTQAADYEQKATGVKTAGTQGAQAATITDNGVVAKVKDIGAGKGSQGVTKEDFERQYNAYYQGPQSASDTAGWGDAQSQAGKVQKFGELAGQGQAGRESLLNETYGQGGQQYQRGEKRLDSFILGGGTEGNKAVEGVAQSYGQYGKNFQDLSAMLDQTYGKAKADTEATRAATQAAVKEARGALGGRFDQAALDASAKTKAADEAYKKYAAGDADALTAAGMDAQDLAYMKKMGYDVSKIATQGKGYKAGDLVSEADVAGYGELASLLGETPAYDLSKGGGSDTAVNQAQIDALKQARGLEGSLNKKLSDARYARGQDATNAFQALGGGATNMSPAKLAEYYAKAGISQEDVARARELGINPGEFISRGRDLDLGDVAGTDGSAYSELLKTLGMEGRVNVMDQGNEGDAWGFDKDRFLADLAAKTPAKVTTVDNTGKGYDSRRRA